MFCVLMATIHSRKKETVTVKCNGNHERVRKMELMEIQEEDCKILNIRPNADKIVFYLQCIKII